MKYGARKLKYALVKCARNTLFRIASKPCSVLVIYLYAERNRYPKTEAFVRHYITTNCFNDCVFIGVDNLSAVEVCQELAPNHFRISGDNSFWEFSGWKKGLQFAVSRGVATDVVVFINDACLNSSSNGHDELFFGLRFDNWSLNQLRSSMYGVVDIASEPHSILGVDVSSWVRSNFFSLPFTVAAKLNWVAFQEADYEKMFPRNYSGSIFGDASCFNPALAKFLTSWITERWHRGQRPSLANWGFLRSKLVAVINERMLTAEVRQHGHMVVDASRIVW